MKKEKVEKLDLGLYKIYWKSEGSSLAAVGQDRFGNKWYAPINWITVPDFDWEGVKRVEKIELYDQYQIELLKIWAELTEAYHGVNGFGGYTAELYAYRFQRYSPMVHKSEPLSLSQLNLKAEIDREAGITLASIVDEFCMQYECSADIDSLFLAQWRMEIETRRRIFDHRAHVTIKTGK